MAKQFAEHCRLWLMLEGKTINFQFKRILQTSFVSTDGGKQDTLSRCLYQVEHIVLILFSTDGSISVQDVAIRHNFYSIFIWEIVFYCVYLLQHLLEYLINIHVDIQNSSASCLLSATESVKSSDKTLIIKKIQLITVSSESLIW